MKKETIEEYLARGGKIERLPYVDNAVVEPIRVTYCSSDIISTEECFIYNGEPNKKKVKNKDLKIDVTKLPSDLVKNLHNLGIKLN